MARREFLMPWDKNCSPVGWYVASYLQRFIEIGRKGNGYPSRRFLAWENTVLIKAKDLDEAYAKVVKIGRAKAKPYRAGPKGIPARWVFEGVTQLLPLYEKIDDGAEIMWAEHTPKMLKTFRRMVKPKRAFRR